MENPVIADVGSVGKGNPVEVVPAVPATAAGEAPKMVNSGESLGPLSAKSADVQKNAGCASGVAAAAAAPRSSRPPSSISEGDRRSPSRRLRRGSKKGHRHGRRSRRTSRAAKCKRARSPAKRSDSSESSSSPTQTFPKKKKNKQIERKELSEVLRKQREMSWLMRLETFFPTAFAGIAPPLQHASAGMAASSTGAAASFPEPAASSAATAAPFPPQPPGAAPKAPNDAIGSPADALMQEGYLTAVKIHELLGLPRQDSGHSDFEQVYAAVQTHVNSQKTLERQRDKLSQAVIALSGVVNTAVKEQEEMHTLLCALGRVVSSEEHLRSLVIAKEAVLTNGGVSVATLLPSPAGAGIPVLSKAAPTQRQDDGTPASIKAKLSQRQPNENWTCPHCGSANGEHRRRCVNYRCRYAGGPPSAWNAVGLERQECPTACRRTSSRSAACCITRTTPRPGSCWRCPSPSARSAPSACSWGAQDKETGPRLAPARS